MIPKIESEDEMLDFLQNRGCVIRRVLMVEVPVYDDFISRTEGPAGYELLTVSKAFEKLNRQQMILMPIKC
jgi:hypothetical protein